MNLILTRASVWLTAAMLVAPSPAVAQGDLPMREAVEALIRQAVAERLGAPAEVDVIALGLPDEPVAFREARPDPIARLGKPVRFALVGPDGRSVYVMAELRVVTDHVVVRQAVGRGHIVGAADVEAVRQELVGTPLRPLPTAAEVSGARALRPLEAGQIVQTGFVVVPRPVEAGDRVTVVAIAGAVRVTASFIAADGGEIGDVVRVSNPETRRVIKGRIVGKGRIEVMYEK